MITSRHCVEARISIANVQNLKQVLRDEISNLLFLDEVDSTLSPELKERKRLLINWYKELEININNLYATVSSLENLLKMWEGRDCENT